MIQSQISVDFTAPTEGLAIVVVHKDHLAAALAEYAPGWSELADFAGEAGKTHLLTLSPKHSVLFAGAEGGDTRNVYKTLLGQQQLIKNWSRRNITLDLRFAPAEAALLTAAVQALRFAFYSPKMLTKEAVEKQLPEALHILLPEGLQKGEQLTQRALLLGELKEKAADLINMPGNVLHPTRLAEEAEALGRDYGFQVEVWSEENMLEEGLHAALAVNKGSSQPASFIVATYRHPEATTHVGIAGKGVTFDTGGISIKPSQNQHYMKSDMGGAAAALTGIAAIAAMKVPVNITVTVPAVENKPDGAAIQPGDVIDSYSGYTIEVIDTDAEGRLILADAVCYLNRTFRPDYLLDFATLTGASVVALGYYTGAVMSKNAELAAALQAAGDKTTDRLWPLPLWDDYKAELDSDVADIRNLGGPTGGAITAGKFLELFTEEHAQWAHVDIAGVAFGDTPLAKQKAGTGYGPELILQFAESLSAQGK